MSNSVVGEVLVHLVGHHDQIVFDGEVGKRSQLFVVENHTGRVVRGVHQQHPSPIGDRRPQFIGIEPVIGWAQGDWPRHCAGHGDARLVRVVHRFEQNDLVTGLEKSEQARRQCLGGPGGDQDFGVRVVRESPEAGLVLGDGLAKYWYSRPGRVLVLS